MKVFISGGCKNGKSYVAQSVARTLAKEGRLYYVATMIPHDDEDLQRIKRHIAERNGWGFKTIECGTSVKNTLFGIDNQGTFLIDSTTALLANEMFSEGGKTDFSAHMRISEELLSFADEASNIVVVSDYIFSDAMLYDEYTEGYRKSLAYIDRVLAEKFDTVLELCGGVVTAHKGEWPV